MDFGNNQEKLKTANCPDVIVFEFLDKTSFAVYRCGESTGISPLFKNWLVER